MSHYNGSLTRAFAELYPEVRFDEYKFKFKPRMFFFFFLRGGLFISLVEEREKSGGKEMKDEDRSTSFREVS
jgi:hypothetical protein